MVRSETPSCSAASLLVISSRPDTIQGSNAARQRVKDWHILTFPDTCCEKCLDSTDGVGTRAHCTRLAQTQHEPDLHAAPQSARAGNESIVDSHPAAVRDLAVQTSCHRTPR